MTPPIALLTVYPPDRVPGLRFRIEQYLPLLEKEGFTVEWISFFSSREYSEFLSEDKSIWRRGWLFVRSLGRSALRALFRKSYRGIYLYREATLLGAPFIEYLWMRGVPVMMDFDDAIWLADVSEQNRSFAWLKSQRKTASLLRKVNLATVCNEFLAAYARQYAAEVQIIPTTIDTDRYQPVKRPKRPYVVVGWSGSFTTLAHLRTIESALQKLHEKLGDKVRFRIIGAPSYRPPFPAEVLPWRPETEIQDLQEIDIGLMPLPDTDWSRGKCALKALQYMALQIPPIVSPVGMNCEVVRDGINGLYARTEREWIEKISFLIEDHEARERLGKEARQTVVERYSVKANAPLYVNAFRRVFGGEEDS